MELRHLRYFLTVGETLNFTRAAAKLRVAQPALSRQVQDLEEEIGVDLLKRSPRGVTLTAEGKLFFDEARDILKRSEEAISKTRALARGEYGELHIGYAASPTVEILPPVLAAFQKAVPRVKVILHDLAGDEIYEGLCNGSLELAVMVKPTEEQSAGLQFEQLRGYRFWVAMAKSHPFTRMKNITVAKVAAEPLVALRRRDFSGYHESLDRIFSPQKLKPRLVVECDSASSLVTEVEIGRGIAVVNEVFRHFSGTRLALRPLSDSTEFHSVGIARAAKGDVTPAGEKFCEVLRAVTKQLTQAK